MGDEWQPTICILCSVNCGIEVKLDGRHIARVRGNRAHVASRGYACEKAQRLDYYQNGRDRLTSPLRRKPDGSFEEVDWDTAIREVAAGFMRVRDRWGGASIFYYGGGGQGNHLVGSYGASTRRALGSGFSSNALAQEKTGEFWVDHRLFGTGLSGGYQQAEVAVFVGKNPWQSHGFQRARPILRDIASDPDRALVVIDPRRTETAEMADYHLRVRPGTDAFCLAAILGTIVQEGLISQDFIRERTENSDELFAVLSEVPVADYCGRAGLDEDLVRAVARRIARASSVSVYEDLGIEQSLHSTLNSYLEKLAVCDHRESRQAGCYELGDEPDRNVQRRVVGSDQPGRRTSHHRRHDSMQRDSRRNPDGSSEALPRDADRERKPRAFCRRQREDAQGAAGAEFVVVIDVAMTESAREAHYILPASSQYEKWEATFFGAAFPYRTRTTRTRSRCAPRFSNRFRERCPRAKFIAGSCALSVR